MAIAIDSGDYGNAIGVSTSPTTWGQDSDVLPPQETQLPKNAALFERVSFVGERIKHRLKHEVKEFIEEFSFQRIEF